MALLRDLFARHLGRHRAIFRPLWLAYKTLVVARHEGPVTARKLMRLAGGPGRPVEAVKFRKLQHPIFIRPGTDDVATAIISFVHEEYANYEPDAAPLRMIDCGAYIGDSSAYFLSKYPNLQVVALEPEPDNYAMANRNLAPYGERIRLLNRAVNDKRGTVHFSGTGDRARMQDADDGSQVEAVTIPDVMELMGWPCVNLLKLDIEGAETKILGPTAAAWLDRVGFVILEVHSVEAERQVHETMTRAGFDIRSYRSLWFCSKNSK